MKTATRSAFGKSAKGLAALLGGAFALHAAAETVYLTQGGEYTDGIDLSVAQGASADWAPRYTDGQNVHSGADYVYSSSFVVDGEARRMADTDAKIRVGIYQDSKTDRTFAGDSLQIGSLDEPTGFFNMNHRRVCGSLDAYGKYAKLILCDGIWYVGGAESVFVGLGGGTIEVRSPATKPFHFYSDMPSANYSSAVRNGSTHGTWSFHSALVGAADVALTFSLNDKAATAFPYDFRLTGDNTGYKGAFIVRNAGARLVATQTAALGASETLRTDAITLADGGALAAPDGADVTLASATRGVTIDATGGRLSAAAGSRLVVRLPISGAGAVRICGGGEVVLAGDYAAGTITVAKDTLLTMEASANLNGARVVYEGGETMPLPFAGETNDLDLAAHDGLTLAFFHGDRVTRGCYTATSVCTTWPVAVRVMGAFVRPAADETFPVLRIPASLKAVTADDFFVSGATPYDHRLTVETDADGLQTVVLSFPKVLSALDLNNAVSTWTDGETTVDAYQAYVNKEGEAFAATYRDFAWNLTLGDVRRINGGYHTAPYLGSPFSVKGLGASGTALLNFCLKSPAYTWDDLRLYGNLFTYGSGLDATIRGKLSILGSEDEPTQFCSPDGNGTTLTVAANLHGDGYAQVCPRTANDGGRTVAFTGDNGRFLGTLDARAVGDATEADMATNFCYWTVTGANGFGGNPAFFTPDAVRLGGGTVLKVAQSLTMPHVNRGFTVREWPTIEVAAGQVFRLCSKLTVAGRLTKTGEGLLILDDVAAEAGAQLVVAAGAVSFGGAVPSSLDVDYASGEIALPGAGQTAAWPTDAPRGAKLQFVCLPDGTTSGCFEMSETAKADFWPIGVTVVQTSRPKPDAKFPVLRIPTSVKAVTLDDFYSASRTPVSESYALETDDDGLQTLYVSFPEVLTATRLQNSTPQTVWRRADGTCVTNSEDGAFAYRVSERSLDADQFRVSNLTNPFAGQSLSVARESGTGELGFPLRYVGAVIPNFRLYGNVSLQKIGGNGLTDIGGDLTVLGTAAHPTAFRAQHDNESYNASFNYAGQLRGDGFLVCAPIALGAGVARLPRLGLSGDNAHFVGTLDVTADAATRAALPMFDPSDGARTNCLTLEVSSPTALGGALPTFDARALRLGWSSVLKVLCDATLAENRGFYVYDSPCVEVAAGATFTVTERTTLNGTLTKTGAGALELAGFVSENAAAGANVIRSDEGRLVLTQPDAVRDVQIVAPTLTLVISRDATEPLVNAVDAAPFGDSGVIRLAWAEGQGVTDEPVAYDWIEVPLLKVKTEAVAGLKSRLVMPRHTVGEFREVASDDGLTLLVLRAKRRVATLLIIR